MGKNKKAKQPAKGKIPDHSPLHSYQLKFELTEEKLAEFVNDPFLVLKLALVEPFVRNGEEYWWCVQPVKVTPEGKVIPLGQDIICRDEAEADATQQNLIAIHKREDEARKLAEKERPIPGKTLKAVYVVGVHSISANGTPLSLILAQPKGSSLSTELPLADVPMVDVGNFYWHGGDGTGQAMKAVVTKSVHLAQAFRLVRYDETIRNKDGAFPYGVEFAEFVTATEVVRVMERWLFATEAEALVLYKQKETEAPKLRSKLLQEPVKSAQELKEEGTIQAIQAMADRAHDPAAKARHLRRIAEIRAEQKERTRAAAEAAAGVAREKAAVVEAANILMDDNFPTVAKVKAELKAANLQPSPEYWENIRRAMKIDCARLGISSPFNRFAMDDQFTVDVTKALKSQSPIKPDQVTAVLNWVSKDYQSMREEEWTACVADQIKAPVKPAGLGKTISKKFGLKSKLKGRPETEVGK